MKRLIKNQEMMVLFLIYIFSNSLFLVNTNNLKNEISIINNLGKNSQNSESIVKLKNKIHEDDVSISFISKEDELLEKNYLDSNEKINFIENINNNPQLNNDKKNNFGLLKKSNLNNSFSDSIVVNDFNYHILDDQERALVKEYTKRKNTLIKKGKKNKYAKYEINLKLEEEKLKNMSCFEEDSFKLDPDSLHQLNNKLKVLKLKAKTKHKKYEKKLPIVKKASNTETYDDGLIDLNLIFLPSEYINPTANIIREIINLLKDFNILNPIDFDIKGSGKIEIQKYQKFYGNLTEGEFLNKRIKIDLSQIFKIEKPSGQANVEKLKRSNYELSLLSFSSNAVQSGIHNNPVIKKTIKVVKKYNIINLIQNNIFNLETNKLNSIKNKKSKNIDYINFNNTNIQNQDKLNRVFIDKYLTDIYNLNFTNKVNIGKNLKFKDYINKLKNKTHPLISVLKKKKQKMFENFETQLSQNLNKNLSWLGGKLMPYLNNTLTNLKNLFKSKQKVFIIDIKNSTDVERINLQKKKLFNDVNVKIKIQIKQLLKKLQKNQESNQELKNILKKVEKEIINIFKKSITKIYDLKKFKNLFSKNENIQDVKNALKNLKKIADANLFSDKRKLNNLIKNRKKDVMQKLKNRQSKNLNILYYDETFPKDLKEDIKLKNILSELIKIINFKTKIIEINNSYTKLDKGKDDNENNSFFITNFLNKLKIIIFKYKNLIEEKKIENKITFNLNKDPLFKSNYAKNKFKNKKSQKHQKKYDLRIKISSLKEFFTNFFKGFNFIEKTFLHREMENYTLYKFEQISNQIVCTYSAKLYENSIQFLPFRSLKNYLWKFNIDKLYESYNSLLDNLKKVEEEIGTRCNGIREMIFFIQKYLNKIKNFRSDYVLELNDLKKIAYNELSKNSFVAAGYTIGKIFGSLKKFDFYDQDI